MTPLPQVLQSRGRVAAGRAFTLLEVMIALAIFFMAVFAILDCTSQSLSAARRLQLNVPDVALALADSNLLLTNRVPEGTVEGDFGEAYHGFSYLQEPPEEVYSNGLYQVQITILGPGVTRPYESSTSLLLWRPEWPRLNPGVRR
jgi:hypothetical protein